MSNNTTFKFFLAGEIHRVSIASASPTLAQLLDSIRSIFPSLESAAHVKVQYIDEDGDRVTLSTQDEWIEALRTLKDSPVKKIYLTENKVDKILPHIFKPRCFIPVISHQGLCQRIADGEDVELPSLPRQRSILRSNIQAASIQNLNQKEYTKALNLLTAALKMFPNSAVDLYNLACTHALMGNEDEACANLKRSVDSGYSNLHHILRDSDLDSIREAAAYKKIIEELQLKISGPMHRFSRSIRMGFGPSSIRSTLLNARSKPQEHPKAESAPESVPVAQKEAPQDPEVKKAEDPEVEKVEKVEKVENPEIKKVEDKKPEDPFAEQKKRLIEMGFGDEELLGALLACEDGSVEAVAEILLDMKI